MALLEEVDEGAGGSADEAENLKAARRRKRANKNRRKKRAEVSYYSYIGRFREVLVPVCISRWRIHDLGWWSESVGGCDTRGIRLN